MKSRKGTQDAILLAASQTGGCGLHDVPGLDVRQVCNNARNLALQGRLFIVGYRQERRIFTDEAEAKRYATVVLPTLKAFKKAAREAARREQRAAARPPKKERLKPEPKAKPDAKEVGVRIKHYTRAPWGPETPAIRPKGLRVTKCPSPPAFGLAAKYGVR